MLSALAGIVIDVMGVWQKAPVPISFSPSFSTTLATEVQLKNALSPILVTLDGIVMTPSVLPMVVSPPQS